jgi:hypothetical protein
VEHVDEATLRAGLAEVRAAPSSTGVVELIVLRPADGQRSMVDVAQLDTASGVVGDNWSTRPNRHTADRRPDPLGQVTVMNARAAALVAGPPGRWSLAGDQLYLDFDLSHANLPAWTRLAVGDAVLEVTGKPHLGCAKFRRRFGDDALRLVNSGDGRALRLRGMNTRVVRAATVRLGDPVRKLGDPVRKLGDPPSAES